MAYRRRKNVKGQDVPKSDSHKKSYGRGFQKGQQHVGLQAFSKSLDTLSRAHEAEMSVLREGVSVVKTVADKIEGKDAAKSLDSILTFMASTQKQAFSSAEKQMDMFYAFSDSMADKFIPLAIQKFKTEEAQAKAEESKKVSDEFKDFLSGIKPSSTSEAEDLIKDMIDPKPRRSNRKKPPTSK